MNVGRSLGKFETEVIEIREEHKRQTLGILKSFVNTMPLRTPTFARSFLGEIDGFGPAGKDIINLPPNNERLIGGAEEYLLKEEIPRRYNYVHIIENRNDKKKFGDEDFDISPNDIAFSALVQNLIARRGPDPMEARAKRHFDDNRQGYFAMALAEAFAAGVEINADFSEIAANVQVLPGSSDNIVLERQHGGPETVGEIG